MITIYFDSSWDPSPRAHQRAMWRDPRVWAQVIFVMAAIAEIAGAL